jgi:hypothetical protein
MSRYTKANHRVFMQFVRRDFWHVTLLEPGLQTPLPKTLTFKDEGKIRELARRRGSLADRFFDAFYGFPLFVIFFCHYRVNPPCPRLVLYPARSFHFSLTTSFAFLSSRRAMNFVCRRWFTSVHSTNSNCPTSFGFSHYVEFRTMPHGCSRSWHHCIERYFVRHD